MIQHAGQIVANAVIGCRYDANEVAAGIVEAPGLRNGRGCRTDLRIIRRLNGEEGTFCCVLAFAVEGFDRPIRFVDTSEETLQGVQCIWPSGLWVLRRNSPRTVVWGLRFGVVESNWRKNS